MENALVKNTLLTLLLAFATFSLTAQDYQGKAMMVSNEAADETIVDIAVSSDAHTTLVAALKAGDLVGTLSGEGPFTVFAPTNAAFEKLPNGTVSTLLEPANKDMLVRVLTYHVIAGEFDAAAVVSAIQANNGSITLETVSGDELSASLKDGSVYLEDENGNWAKVTATDLKGSNGVIHVIDTVVLPE